MKCAICQREFKMITGKHLKQHDMTVSDYKAQFGPVTTPEYRQLKSKQSAGSNNPNFGNTHPPEARQQISASRKGIPAHNKGKPMPAEQKVTLSLKALARNQKWREDSSHPPLSGTSLPTCELRQTEGYIRIYDAGSRRFTWNNIHS